MYHHQSVNRCPDEQSVALVLVAKQAVPGRVKTRLLPHVSANVAAAIFNLFLQRARHLCERAASDNHYIQLVLLFDPPNSIDAWSSWTRWIKLAQPDGDLGDRLRSAQAILTKNHTEGCVFLGADAPELTTDHLNWAVDQVRQSICAMVPSYDGGYVLIGVPRGSQTLFDGIAWSTPEVAAQSRQAAQRNGLKLTELPPVADIDHHADLIELIARLKTSSCHADHILRERLIGILRAGITVI
jgi:rSAM/selenodomain-associated transferase 1